MYQDIIDDLHIRHRNATQHHNPAERIILEGILFAMPTDRPAEARANLQQLAEQTREQDLKERYTQLMNAI